MINNSFHKNFKDRATYFIEKNLKLLVVLVSVIMIISFISIYYKSIQTKNNIKIAEQYTQASILLNKKKIKESKTLIENIISKEHKFYSPLALYFIIDNNLEADRLKILDFFDIILSINSIDKENLNLIKIKKAVFLLNSGDEDAIIKILNPIVNSDSVWRNMAIKLMSDYFLSKDQKIKSEEYLQLLNNKIKE